MAINEKIIGYAREVTQSKGLNELNLVRGEADQMNLQSSQDLADLIQTLGQKITPTEYIIAWKLDKILQNFGLDWESLQWAQKELLTKLILSEPAEDLSQKFPVANAIYEKIGADGSWERASQDEQNRAIAQIGSIAHLAKKDTDLAHLKQTLDAAGLDAWDVLAKLAWINKALQSANLIKISDLMSSSPKKTGTLKQRPSVEPVSNVPVDQDAQRIKKTFEENEKPVDFGARAQVSGRVHTSKKKTKSRDDLIREGYRKAEEEARKHLEKQLKKENANMKNLHRSQKRFQTETTTTTTKKDRKGWFAWALTGGVIGGSALLGYLFS